MDRTFARKFGVNKMDLQDCKDGIFTKNHAKRLRKKSKKQTKRGRRRLERQLIREVS